MSIITSVAIGAAWGGAWIMFMYIALCCIGLLIVIHAIWRATHASKYNRKDELNRMITRLKRRIEELERRLT